MAMPHHALNPARRRIGRARRPFHHFENTNFTTGQIVVDFTRDFAILLKLIQPGQVAMRTMPPQMFCERHALMQIKHPTSDGGIGCCTH